MMLFSKLAGLATAGLVHKLVKFGALIGAIGLFTFGLTAQPASASPSITPLAVGSYYEIASAVSANQCADVTGKSTSPHALVQAYECKGTDNQLWAFVPTNTGSYKVVNRGSGLCLDVDSNFPAGNGDLLQQFYCVDQGTAQRWRLLAAGGAYRITDETTGLCLSFPDTFANGAKLEMWDCIPDDIYQLWTLK